VKFRRRAGWERQGCGQPAEKIHCRDGIIDHQAAKAADAAFIRNALSGCQFHGSNVVNSWILVRPETIRSSTSVSQAIGSTPLSLAVWISVIAMDKHSEFIVLSVQFAMLLRRGSHHIAQHLPQEFRIVRQPFEIDLHRRMMIDDAASTPAFPAGISPFSTPPAPVGGGAPAHATRSRRATPPIVPGTARSGRSWWLMANEIGPAQAVS
jgi:hypothetical protein